MKNVILFLSLTLAGCSIRTVPDARLQDYANSPALYCPDEWLAKVCERTSADGFYGACENMNDCVLRARSIERAREIAIQEIQRRRQLNQQKRNDSRGTETH